MCKCVKLLSDGLWFIIVMDFGHFFLFAAPTSIGKRAAKKLQEGHSSASATTTKGCYVFSANSSLTYFLAINL